MIDGFWMYEPLSDTWTALSIPNIQSGITSSTKFDGFVLDNSIYYFFNTDKFYEYATNSATWNLKANFPGGKRIYPSAFSVGSYGYLGLGYSHPGSPSQLKDFYQYDPQTDTWKLMAQYPYIASTPSNTYANSVNGFTQEYGSNIISNGFCKVYQYGPTLNTWERKSDFQRNVHNMAPFNIGDRIFIGTGDALEPEYATSSGSATFAKGTNEFWEFIP